MSEVAVEYTNGAGNRRRLRFVARPVHDQWHRFEEELDGGEWRGVGHDIVEDVDVQHCPEPGAFGPRA